MVTQYAVDIVITKIRSGWSKFRDLVHLLAIRSLSFGAKGRLYSGCVHSVMLYGSEAWPKIEEHLGMFT